MFDDCIIMAGGSGTRLWPASCWALPKQFLPVGEKEGESFFEASVKRGLSVVGKTGRVIIIAGRAHIPCVINDCAKLTPGEKKRLVIIAEPSAKSTAPAIACAVAYSMFSGKSRKIIVLTSDHVIEPIEAFQADAELAANAAAEKKLVVFGIIPTRADTGYGYIETYGKKGHAPASGMFAVRGFREKPDLVTAKKFVAAKRFFWNSGMFAFSTDFMAAQFRALAPEVFTPFEKLEDPEESSYTNERGLRILGSWRALSAVYSDTNSISFDYAIAEKCADRVMVPASFKWVDIGNWEDYAALRGSQTGDVFSVDSTGCHVDSDIPVALAGVKDIIVVIRTGKDGFPTAALVTRKGQTQKVRDVVDLLKKAGKTDLL